jgi:hypothetical protein
MPYLRHFSTLVTVSTVAMTVVACAATTDDDPDTEATVSSEVRRNYSDDEVSSAYNCAANGIWTVAGGAGAVACGLGAAPSGGLTVLCYVASGGSAAGGALAYCGGRCPGFRNICPGYAPPSFRETSRLVSRCVGTARYSHWELTDPALIRKYGRSQREFRNGDCVCPRGRTCPTPD